MASGTNKHQQKPPADQRGKSLLLLGTGTLLASMVIAGFLLGYFVDHWLDTKPWFMLTLALLGLIGAFIKLHKLLTGTEI